MRPPPAPPAALYAAAAAGPGAGPAFACPSTPPTLLHPGCLPHLPLSPQPMEIYVDDEAKLTLHGLVQVSLGVCMAGRRCQHACSAERQAPVPHSTERVKGQTVASPLCCVFLS